MITDAAKVLLVAHQDADVRDRFVAALADARHKATTAATETDALTAARQRPPISLALIDLRLCSNAAEFVRELREASQPALPVLAFAGSLRDAAQARDLTAVGVAGYVNDFASTAAILPALAPHLFPSSFDRRLAPRMTMSVPVSYQSGGVTAGALTLNVSRGGLAIRTLSPLPAGGELLLRFRLPSWAAEIERRGHVVWSDGRVGMGIQFDDEIDV